MGLEGKVALVTGVTSGVGRGVAKVFADAGMKVVGTGRREHLGIELQDQLRSAGRDFTFVRGDVATVAGCQAQVDATVAAYGRIDVLVNNAGVVGDPAVCASHEVTEEQWDYILGINLKGAFFTAQAAIRQMLAQGTGGNLIHVSSINAKVLGPTGMIAYTASKAGMAAMARGLATEYLMNGIRSNAIILGGVEGETGFDVQIRTAKNVRGEDYEPKLARKDENPIIMLPEEVGDALLMLCDDRARMINGSEVVVDNCYTAGLPNDIIAKMTISGLWTFG